MSIPFTLHLQLPWQDPEFLLHHRGGDLPMVQRSLLACRGSLTRHLESLAGQTMGVRLARQEWIATAEVDTLPAWVHPSPWEGLRPLSGDRAILVRDAWLTITDQEWFFAHSQVAATDLPADLRQAIEAGEQPLGSLFLEQQGAVDRLDLALNLATAPILAQQKHLPTDHLFWCRRSLLSVADIPRARILEIFLPE